MTVAKKDRAPTSESLNILLQEDLTIRGGMPPYPMPYTLYLDSHGSRS